MYVKMVVKQLLSEVVVWLQPRYTVVDL